MDKPLGPRHPDKRNAAYESIFGRPSASHHQLGPPPLNFNYPQSQPALPNGLQPYYPDYDPPYQANLERRTSHAGSFAPSFHSQTPSPHQHPPSTYRGSYYPPIQQQPPQQQYSPYGPPSHVSSQALGIPHSRSRSVASNNQSSGVLAPPPEDPPDASLEALTRSGLTPAQAYQAQVYLNSPVAQQGDWNRYRDSSGSIPDRNSLHQSLNGAPPVEAPRLGINLEQADGRLGIDFASGNGSGSDPGTDEGSELPWARSDRPRESAMSTSPGPPQNPAITRIKQPNVNRYSGASDQSIDSPTSGRPHPLQLDTSLPATYTTSALASSPASSTLVGDGQSVLSSSSPSTRRSSESARTMPRGPNARRDRNGQDRAMSMSAATSATMRTMMEGSNRNSRPPIPTLQEGRTSPVSVRHTRRTPIVYPALLSRVAEAFRDRIPVAERVKDGLAYKDAFDGREAVDKIAYIIKTTDRNLALLLGRALDAQKFFHDVTYDHRLRDSANELYQFRTIVPSPFVSGELENGGNDAQNGDSVSRPLLQQQSPTDSSVFTQSSSATSANQTADSPVDTPDTLLSPQLRPRKGSVTADDIPLPSGVFTLLTDCYSPTCSRDELCYSIACPRRMEQQARLNMKPQPGLKKQISRESLGDVVEPGTLWIHSVSQEIVNSVTDAEKKRQEAINEVIYTERDFVRDMEYLREQWINRLKELDVIPKNRRTDFIDQVFWNIDDIIAVNTRLRDALNKRQKAYSIVEQIGDILRDVVPQFGPFVRYGSHQLYGKLEFEKEKSSNPAFAQFVETTERLPESRKLELNAYLTKPTTRLARYPLLLEAVLKNTPDESPDKATLPEVIAIIRHFLDRVNEETGRAENRVNLLNLDQQLIFRPGEEVNLRLKDEDRELIFKGTLNKRGGAQGDSGDLQVFLFDHALLLAKQQRTKHGHDSLKVYRRPIPLELLLIAAPDDPASASARQQGNRQKQSLIKKNSFTNGRVMANMPNVPVNGKNQFSITFIHLGRKYYHMTLWASTYVSQRKWVEHIAKQQDVLRDRSMVFDVMTLSEGFFHGHNKVNCAAPFNNGRRVVYGTDDGVYISEMRDGRDPVKVLALLEVVQVDVLEDYQLLLVLSERQVITFPLEALDPHDPMAGLKRAKKISSHTSFFKAGFCLGKVLVCIVKSSPLSSTFKTLEPIEQNVRSRNKPTFKKLLQGGHDTLKLFREFYIPVESTSIHYLKTKMCVGCSKGFEIVDLESLDTQGLLDPHDEALEFVRKRENARPMAIYRIDNEFLLCYDEFAFYVNKNGRRSRKEFMVYWEGSPTGFALHQPYVLAFEPTFVEVRHIENGLLSQIIQGTNLRLLFADTPPSTTNSAVSSMSGHPYQPGYDHPAYAAQAPYGRQPPYAGYGGPPGYPNQYYRNPQGVGRDEIIMVSEDHRVLTLRPTAPTGAKHFSVQSDGLSMRSSHR